MHKKWDNDVKYLLDIWNLSGIMCVRSVMNEDLAVFEKADGITKEQFERSKGRATHYQIIDHKLYRQPDCMFPAR